MILDEKDVQQLQNEVNMLKKRIRATEFSMGIEFLESFIETSFKAFAVVRAVEMVIKHRSSESWADLKKALEPFQAKEEK